jgi:hypothetical protein
MPAVVADALDTRYLKKRNDGHVAACSAAEGQIGIVAIAGHRDL